MLFLIFQLGTDRYAIEATQVVEVLPLVNAKQIPRAPLGMAGVFDYHGTPVLLVDLAELVQGTASRKWMSTRIVLVNHLDKLGKHRLVGFLAEHSTETMRRPQEDFADSGLSIAEAPYLGPVLTDAAGIIQQIRLQDLLADSIGSQLFRERVESL
jgi:chemotaxis-related protein WspB